MIDIYTHKVWCNHCKTAADFDTHAETCEFTALKKEVEDLRKENLLMKEILMASYAPRTWTLEELDK